MRHRLNNEHFRYYYRASLLDGRAIISFDFLQLNDRPLGALSARTTSASPRPRFERRNCVSAITTIRFSNYPGDLDKKKNYAFLCNF